MVQSTKNTQMCFGHKKERTRQYFLLKGAFVVCLMDMFEEKCRQKTTRKRKGNNNEMVNGGGGISCCYIQF